MELVKRIFHWVEKAFVVVAIAVAIGTPLALHYLPLPADWKGEALPTAVALAFIVVLRLLFSIEKKVGTNVSYREYRTMTDAVPDMLQILKRQRSRPHTVKVLASTGATTVNTLLPGLAQRARDERARFDFQIKLIAPDSPLAQHMPPHWREEVRVSIKRLEDFRQAGVTIACFQYPYLPCLGGVLIDENHLFLGFYLWEQSQQTTTLQGAEQPHFYFRRGSRTEYPFRLWESWFDLAPERAAGPQVSVPVPSAPVPPAAPKPPKKLIVAHRGVVASGAHENTLAAFQNAIDLGADMIEFDVRRTSDGVLVSCHDDSIGGLTINSHTHVELRAAAEKTGFELATVEDVVRVTSGKIMLDVELKEEGYETDVLKVLSSVDPAWLRITSFNPSSIQAVKTSQPSILAGLLVESLDQAELRKRYAASQADFLAPHFDLLDIAANVGNGLFVWTVNDIDSIRALLQHPKVAAIITNRTEAGLRCRSSIS